MKTIAIHQPNFAPWGGYFQKMIDSDEFVILDDCQFTKGSYINRVKIGSGIYTIPVTYEYGQNINEVMIHNPRQACHKLFKTIQHNYKEIANDYEWLTDVPVKWKLMGLNMTLLAMVRSELSINTPISYSNRLGINLNGSDRILEICKQRGATHYLTGKGGLKYLDEKKFNDNGIKIELVNTQNFDDVSILHYINEIRKSTNENTRFSTAH